MSFAEYDRYDAIGLAELVRRREVSAADLLEEAVGRAERLNPHLNAIVTPMYDIAHSALAMGLPTGPFSGVPFLLKDLLHDFAGVPISSGSRAMRGYVPQASSEVVQRFRRAGLVPFGKTNVPELGLVAVTEPEAFGPTRNPWDLERSPGGSSGGSAAAVAAGIVPIASATDGGGSIRIPAGWTGLFGLKPSRGRVPSGPAFAEVWDGAVAEHVISRSVRDSAAMLDALIGPAPGDPYVWATPERPFLDEVGRAPGRLRIAYTTRSPLGTAVHPECVRAVEETVRLLEELGHEAESREPAIDGMAVARAYLILYFAQVSADLRWVVENLGRKAVEELEDVTRVLSIIGERLPAAEYVESRRSWNAFARVMGSFHEDFDLFLTPTAAVPPPLVGSLDATPVQKLALKLVRVLRAGSAFRATGLPERLSLQNLASVPFTQLANLTGQPAMSVPLHWTSGGLPCGSQFIAPVGGEGALIRLAAQLEEARPWAHRRPPLGSVGDDAPREPMPPAESQRFAPG